MTRQRFKDTFHKIEFIKLAQKECKTMHDWVGKVIHWELRKSLRFNHNTKWYMYKIETVPENQTKKIAKIFENNNKNENCNRK